MFLWDEIELQSGRRVGGSAERWQPKLGDSAGRRCPPAEVARPIVGRFILTFGTDPGLNQPLPGLVSERFGFLGVSWEVDI